MPRTQRLKINDETAVYHVMSRTALDGFPLNDIEKDFPVTQKAPVIKILRSDRDRT